jgi:integrase
MAKRQMKTTRHTGVFRLNDGRWWIEATQRDQDGKRVARREALAATLTLEEAARERARLVAALADEIAQRREVTLNGGLTPGATLSAYAEQWMGRRVAAGKKDSTRDRDLRALAHWILPAPVEPGASGRTFGEIPVGELTRAHVERWVVWAQGQRRDNGEPYAHDTLLTWWRVAVTLLKDAAADLHLIDPTFRVSAPRSTVRGRRERVTLKGDQLGALLGAIRVHAPEWFDEVFTCAFTGMRPGELYALRWEDVDERAGVIHVARSVGRSGKVGTPKTGDPREVALTEPLQEVLTARRRRMLAEQHPGLASGLIFPSATGGHRLGPSLLKVIETCRREVGIPTRVGPQVLRRTLNTLLVEQGVSNIVIQQQIGHVSDAMTRLYAGVHAGAKREALDRVWQLVEEAGKP